MTRHELELLTLVVQLRLAVEKLQQSRDEWKAVALRAVDVAEEAASTTLHTFAQAPDDVRGKETRMA
jgi:hypothetical protein